MVAFLSKVWYVLGFTFPPVNVNTWVKGLVLQKLVLAFDFVCFHQVPSPNLAHVKLFMAL